MFTNNFPIINILLHCKHLDNLYNEKAILMPINIIDLCILVFFFQSKISVLIFHQLQYKFFGCLEVFQHCVMKKCEYYVVFMALTQSPISLFINNSKFMTTNNDVKQLHF
jgi:hypothetical protein